MKSIKYYAIERCLHLNGNTRKYRELRHVNKHINVVIVSLHVLVLYQPLNLLLDQLLAWQEHILENIHQFSLQ